MSIIPELFPKKRYSFSSVRRSCFLKVREARSSVSSSASPSGAGEESEDGLRAFSFSLARIERVAMFIALYALFLSDLSFSGSNNAHTHGCSGCSGECEGL